MAKTTPWTKIKAEYLQGATPKQLAEKYKLTAKQVSDKATKDNWTKEKSEIGVNLRENIQNKIQDLSNNALQVLSEVMNNPESENKDKVSAARAILDVSGLKSIKQEIKADVESNVVSNVSDEKIEQIINKLRNLHE